jgi:CheY-like chemotaxis protein
MRMNSPLRAGGSIAPAPASPRLRPILMVEDNDMDLDLCMQAFREHAIANPLVSCRDGEEAIQYIDTHGDPADLQLPVIVLLDLRLPKIDGIDVLRHAREHPIWRQVPFIVLTTSREDSDIGAAYRLGVNSYIVKPVDFVAFSDVAKRIEMYWVLTNVPPFKEP